MSCAFFTFAAWYGAAHNKNSGWHAKAAYWLGAAVIAVAMYLAWREQYLKVQKRDRRIRGYEDRAADLVEVSKIIWEGSRLAGSAPHDTASASEVEEWKNAVEKWKKETAELLLSISPIAANKFAFLHTFSSEHLPHGIHKAAWVQLSIMNARIENLTKIMEKPNIYLAKLA